MPKSNQDDTLGITDKTIFTFREIMYRVLALIFLVAVIAAVLLIAEDTNAAVDLRDCVASTINLYIM